MELLNFLIFHQFSQFIHEVYQHSLIICHWLLKLHIFELVYYLLIQINRLET